MRPSQRLSASVIGALALATLVASAIALVALNNGGQASLGPLPVLRLGAGYDRRAEPLLMGASLLKRSARTQAAQLSRAAIREYPYDTSAWLRLAYVDSIEHGVLSKTGAAHLQRSYDLVAIDSFVGLWRVRFALENSQSLSPDLRGSVRNEASALWKNGENQPALREMASTIRNPAGRLSMALWLNRLEAPVAK